MLWKKAVLLPGDLFHSEAGLKQTKSHTYTLFFSVAADCKICIDASPSSDQNTTFCFREAFMRKKVLAGGRLASCLLLQQTDSSLLLRDGGSAFRWSNLRGSSRCTSVKS